MKTTLALIACLMCGCATRAELKLHKAEERIAELERFIAGAQDDNAMLQKYGIALQGEIREWQMGAAMQAQALAKARENCEL